MVAPLQPNLYYTIPTHTSNAKIKAGVDSWLIDQLDFLSWELKLNINSNTGTLSIWHWGGLGAGGEGDNRGWDGWMASPSWWAWVWVNSGSWWWRGRPGMLRFMGSQRVGQDWATELNWTELKHLTRGLELGGNLIMRMSSLFAPCRSEKLRRWVLRVKKEREKEWADV